MVYVQCYSCGKEFGAGVNALRNHCNSTGHTFLPRYECDHCVQKFSSMSDCEDHMDYCGSSREEYECHVCYNRYCSEEDRQEHEVDDHLFCAECDRTFVNKNGIVQHLRSRLHRGDATLCPFCRDGFPTASAMTLHLERGFCSRAPSLSRDTMYQAVRSRDPHGVVSKKLLEWEPSGSLEATDKAWNGSAYECYFCDKIFRRLPHLNQHLKSPVHQQALYHCPNLSCRKDFGTLAAVVSHLESETCGFRRFDSVQTSIRNIVSSNRLIGF